MRVLEPVLVGMRITTDSRDPAQQFLSQIRNAAMFPAQASRTEYRRYQALSENEPRP